MPSEGRDSSQGARPSPERQPDGEQGRFVAIGEATAPHGVQGYFRVRILTDFPERFKQLRRVYVGEDHCPYDVAKVRVLPDQVLLKLVGIDSPEAARVLAHRLIYVPEEETVPLPVDQYYWYQIIGLEVWTRDGRCLGRVVEILETGSNDVYVVQGPQGEVLVPAIEDVVVAVETAKGRLVIQPMEGML